MAGALRGAPSPVAPPVSITPYEVALLPTKVDALLFINQLINIIFIIDIFVNFFMPYRESLYDGGGMVRSHTRIMLRYLRSWLILSDYSQAACTASWLHS